MKRKTKSIIIVIILLIILAIIGIVIYDFSRKSYDVEEVIEEKYFLLLSKQKVGIIDKKGNEIINPYYYAIHIPNPSKPIFVCYYDNNESTGEYKTKIINERGTELFTKYQNVETINLNDIQTNMPYEKNVLRYEKDGKYGLIDLKGNIVTKAEYDWIDGLSNKEGELLVLKDGKYGVINTKGAELIETKYDYISGDGYYTNEKKYALSGYILGVKTTDGYRYGYMTCDRKMILETEYNEVMRLGGIGSEDTDKDIFLLAQKDGQFGMIKNKKVIIDFRYQEIDYSGVNNLFIVTRSSKSGVYNSSGKKILAVKYGKIEANDTYLYTELNGEEAYYNLIGNRIDKSTIKEDEEDEESTEETKVDVELIKNEKNGKWGFVDKNSNVIVENIYDEVTEFNTNGFAGIKLNGKWGSIDEKGNVIIEPVYNLDNLYEIDFIGKYYKIICDYKTTYYSDDMN